MIFKPLNFVNEVAKSISQIDTNLKNPDKCVEFISDKLDKIDRLKSDSFFPQTDAESLALEEKGNDTLAKLFHIQLMVRTRNNASFHFPVSLIMTVFRIYDDQPDIFVLWRIC